MEQLNFSPIGTFRCPSKFKFDLPKQGHLNSTERNLGIITLDSSRIPNECLEDINGFDRLWVIYEFHKNKSWKPKTLPPTSSNEKRGVFATRSPYRPNPIGLSCVKLVKVEGFNLFVSEYDLIDETPILDLKPYLATADSFPHAKAGWTQEIEDRIYGISYSEEVLSHIQWIENNTRLSLKTAIESQLRLNPFDHRKKRIRSLGFQRFILSYRTWRVFYSVEDSMTIHIEKMASGYSLNELSDDSEDKWRDKRIHSQFMSQFDTKLSTN